MLCSGLNLNFLFYCFIAYALLGWILEVTYHIFKLHKFVNRGFLYGPLCPIYGIGGVFAVIFLERFKDNYIVLFAGGFILGSVVEFAAGYLLEVFFKTKWWDYTNEGPNILGYVCLKFSLIWGLLSVVFIQFINPPVSALIKMLPRDASQVLYQILLVVLVVDITATINNLIQFRKFFNELHEISQEIKANIDELKEKALSKAGLLSLENRNMHLRALYERLSTRITMRHRSFLGAYPGITSKRFGSVIEEVRNKLKEARKSAKNKSESM